MEGLDEKNMENEELYANVVRAGKRTYFFDVRATRGNDFYLTITESKRKYADDGSYQYQKHKIFLYKEDFEKFGGALSDAFKKIIELKRKNDDSLDQKLTNQFVDIDFDDLEEK